MEGSFSDVADTLIGVTLTLVLIVGVPANIIALVYFSKQRNANPVQVRCLLFKRVLLFTRVLFSHELFSRALLFTRVLFSRELLFTNVPFSFVLLFTRALLICYLHMIITNYFRRTSTEYTR